MSSRRSPGYVDRDGVSLLHFVNRYIRTRRRSVNNDNRRIVRDAICSYRGSFPARCAELEAFLDSILQVEPPSPEVIVRSAVGGRIGVEPSPVRTAAGEMATR